MDERPNFYLLLEIDPSVDDWPTIEQQIHEKQRIWSRDRSMGNPKARRHAASSLALMQEIKTILEDPQTRKREAKEALRQQQAARQAQARELDEAISVIRTSGQPCSVAQLEQLTRRFQSTFSPADIRKRLEESGVPIAGARLLEEPMDRVTASRLRNNLDHLGLATLYDFLGLSPEASPRALSDRADEIYRENQRLGRTDAKTSASNELAGICKSLFRDEREKSKYDAHLVAEIMEGLRLNIDLAGSEGVLNQAATDALLDQALQRGVARDKAHAFIESYAAARKWKMESQTSKVSGESSPREDPRVTSMPPPRISNVTSKSFGIVVTTADHREAVVNLILVDDPVPKSSSLSIETQEEGLTTMKLHCMENRLRDRQVEISQCHAIGHAVLEFARPLPKGSVIDVTFSLGPDGLLSLTARDLTNKREVKAQFHTEAILPRERLEESKRRNMAMEISSGVPRSAVPGSEVRQPSEARAAAQRREQVFISYSHKDKIWLERLQNMLKPLVRKGTISLWDNTKITPGKEWKKELEHALATAKVAVLLVSQNFIASDFISENELPPLLQAAEREGLVIIWLPLGYCLWDETEIRRYQAAHDPSRPLSILRRTAERDRVLAHVCRQIKEAISPSRPQD